MRIHPYWIAIAILALASMAAAQSGSKTLGTVNGQTITEDEVNKAAANDLENLEIKRIQAEANHKRDQHEIIEKTLDGLIEEKLLAAEAAKRKVSAEEVLQTEVDRKVTPPTDGEINRFWEENKSRIPISREEALPQIGPYLMEQKKIGLREVFFAKLKKDYSVKSYLEPLRVDVASVGHPSLGPANAPVTIVEFSDFQCPFCGNLYPALKEIEKNYATKVRLVYRQYPLTSIHPYAQKAAEASLCANEQNRFWEYHDSLFENQKELEVDALKSRAGQLKLDTAAFSACLDSGKQKDAIQKDIVEGTKAGVGGTPTMYMNGRQYRGDLSYSAVAKFIDDELERKTAGK